MKKLEARAAIMKEAKLRVSSMNHGDPITNVCAGDGNPRRYSYFSEYVVKSYASKGFIHKDYLARCTDKEGNYWETGIDVIHPGHLNREKCEELFEPVWESEFGK